MKIIDSHQHFWDPPRGDYHWMPKDNPILNKKYEVKDLSKDSESINLHKTILVQAAATNAETEYMLNIAENSDLVCGVVGWVNFEDKNQLEQLKIFSNHPKFIGVRPMIQDIPDENWVLNQNFDNFFKSIIDLDLSAKVDSTQITIAEIGVGKVQPPRVHLTQIAPAIVTAGQLTGVE